MKIGIDARFYRSSTGGIGRYTRALLKNLAKLDKKNKYVIFLTPLDMKEYDIKAENFSEVVAPISHYSFAEQTKFLKILNEAKLDLVHFTNFNHPVFYKRKFIVTVHDLTLMLYPQSKNKYSWLKKSGFRLVMQNAVKAAKCVISDSDATKKDLIKYLSANAEKIKTIYLGIDDEYRRVAKTSLDTLEKKYKIKTPYLLFISQWRPHKGIGELVEAFETLKTKYNIAHKLVIVGKSNPNFPSIAQTIQSSKWAKDIIVTGFVDDSDLPAIYKHADLFVFPSHYEGFGLPPLEAMAGGTPVAASNVSCIPEILGAGAMYFDPYKPAEMAKKIYDVITQKNLKDDLIKKGLEISQKYHWQKTASETLKLYEKANTQ